MFQPDEAFRDRANELLLDRPAGLLMIGFSVDDRKVAGKKSARPITELGATLAERLVEVGRDDDVVTSIGSNRILLLRAPLDAPAEAEGLAFDLHEEMTKPVVTADGPVECLVAIGVAVSGSGDDLDQLLRHAGHAFDDAMTLGADRVVPFDEVDRELLTSE